MGKKTKIADDINVKTEAEMDEVVKPLNEEDLDAVLRDIVTDEAEAEVRKANAPKPKKKKKKGGKVILILLLIFCICIALVSGFLCLRKFYNDKTSQDEYDNIRNDVIIEDNTYEVIDDVMLRVVNPELPFDVDFESLKAMNEDIIAWIYIPCLDLSYPVVQCDNNYYYLDHTIEKTPRDSGALFMDKHNNSDFSDAHSFIYGHNMKNKSMFGKLHRITWEGASEANQYVWIYTPEHIYRYQMFSSFETSPQGDPYVFYDKRSDSFVNWCNKMYQHSVVDFPEHEFTVDDCVLSLSTCGANTSIRTLVMCYREKEFEHYVMVPASEAETMDTEMATIQESTPEN